MADPHDAPGIRELVDAVREFLERDVMGATEGRVQFHTRVAINVLAIVERELTLGADQAARYREGLAALGMADASELAAAIRSGSVDHRLAEVSAFVRRTVGDKLDVANPRYAG